MLLRKIIVEYLRESADKLDRNECGLDESEILGLALSVLHIKINKVQAADYLHISTRTLDRKIENGDIPSGRKDFGSNQLYWYKDELILG